MQDGPEFEIRIIETGGASNAIASHLPVSCILAAIKAHVGQSDIKFPSRRILIYLSIGKCFSVHRLLSKKYICITLEKETLTFDDQASYQFASEVMYSLMLFHFINDRGSAVTDDDIRNRVTRIVEVDISKEMHNCLDAMISK